MRYVAYIDRGSFRYYLSYGPEHINGVIDPHKATWWDSPQLPPTVKSDYPYAVMMSEGDIEIIQTMES